MTLFLNVLQSSMCLCWYQSVHLLHHHENDSDFDKVHDFFQESGADCQVLSCPNMERNNRNRATCTDIEVPLSKLYGASEPKEVNAQQIMDQMHCQLYCVVTSFSIL